MRDETGSFRQRMEDLNSPDMTARRRALRSLGFSRSKVAVQALIDALDDPSVAAAAADALSHHREAAEAVPKLITLLEAPSDCTRLAAIESLAEMRDPRAVEPLAVLLNDPDERVRLDAAKALGRMGDRRALQPMIDAVKAASEEHLDRQSLWHDIGDMGFADDVAHLSHLLHSDNWTVTPEDRKALLEPPAKPLRRLSDGHMEKIRRDIEELGSADQERAWRAVRRLGRRRGYVVELLAEATASPHSEVRHLALHALERVGDPRAGRLVLEMAHDPVRDTWWCAYEILGKIWKKRAIPTLIEALGNPDPGAFEVRGVIDGLAAVGSPAISALAELIDLGDSEVRCRAAWALSNIPEAAVIGPLSRLLRDPNSETRVCGIESLSSLGRDHPQDFAEPCLVLIEPLLNDPSPEVCESARFAIDEIRQNS